jgi:triacylglycerol lipase
MTVAAPVPVLLHGFLGFPRLGPIPYFRGIETALRMRGIVPLIPALPPAGSIADRAAALAVALRDHAAERFVLLGHSMGGLDGRFAISRLDPDRRIRAITTVATPHLGSSVAMRILDGSGIGPALGRSALRAALTDLDPRTRQREPIPDRPDVAYLSYVTKRRPADLPLPLRYTSRGMTEENDGLVPVSSAAWGTVRNVVIADHFEIVGWSLRPADRLSGRPFAHVPFWCHIVQEALTRAVDGDGDDPGTAA